MNKNNTKPMVQIANPIYDVVFKYPMTNKKVANLLWKYDNRKVSDRRRRGETRCTYPKDDRRSKPYFKKISQYSNQFEIRSPLPLAHATHGRVLLPTSHFRLPGRAVRYLPAPPQTRTSGFPAYGSSDLRLR